MGWWVAAMGGVLLALGAGYLWWDARKAREALRQSRPLYGWWAGDPYDPNGEATHFLTKRPPRSRGDAEEEDPLD